MFEEKPLSCGTPSMTVLIPGLVGLPPMPLKKGFWRAWPVNPLMKKWGD